MSRFDRPISQEYWEDVCPHCEATKSVLVDITAWEAFVSGKPDDNTMVFTCDLCGECRVGEVDWSQQFPDSHWLDKAL